MNYFVRRALRWLIKRLPWERLVLILLDNLDREAKKTDNTIDDQAVKLLKENSGTLSKVIRASLDQLAR